MEKQEWAKIVAEADAEVARRLTDQQEWDVLKRSSVKGLRSQGHRAPKLNDREMGFAGQVMDQAVEVKSVGELGYRNFDEWFDSSDETESGVYNDPDTFAEHDAYNFTPVVQPRPDLDMTVSRELMGMFGDVLTDRQLQIYHLHIESGLTHTEVATQLGLDVTHMSRDWAAIETKLRNKFTEMLDQKIAAAKWKR